MSHRPATTFCALFVVICCAYSPVHGLKQVQPQERLTEAQALKEATAAIGFLDGKGRWFSFSVAAVGALGAIAAASWALVAQPAELGQDPASWISAVSLAGAGFGLLVHGAMRFEERSASFMSAQSALATDEVGVYRLYLNHRIQEARSTRFWGGVLTTLQGVSATVLGIRMLRKRSYRAVGITVAACGVLTTAIGAIHFIGNPRSERIRDRTLELVELSVAPVLMPNGNDGIQPGMALSGRF